MVKTKVILYSTECPRCEMLKSKLNEKKIEYETVSDVEKMLSIGIFTVPYLELDGELLDFRDAFKWASEK